jgi:hypothetical protein
MAPLPGRAAQEHGCEKKKKKKMKEIQCPKCKSFSGDDWSSCEGHCPMPMSPHFDPDVEPRFDPETCLVEVDE